MSGDINKIDICEFLISPSPRLDQPCLWLISGHLKRSVVDKARQAKFQPVENLRPEYLRVG